MSLILYGIGWAALLQLLSVAVLGERAVPNAGLHPRFTRATVYAAWVAAIVFLPVLVLVAMVAWLS